MSANGRKVASAVINQLSQSASAVGNATSWAFAKLRLTLPKSSTSISPPSLPSSPPANNSNIQPTIETPSSNSSSGTEQIPRGMIRSWIDSFNSYVTSTVSMIPAWVPSTAEQYADAESRVLASAVRYTRMKNVRVPIGNDNVINSVVSENHSPEKINLVMCHGWAAGLAFWSRNFDGLSSTYNIHALDWLGFGRSSRPPFKGKTAEDAENWWIEGLESWRKAQGLDKFVLCGHSLGGYLSACYALKYPQHVSYLILASPAGVPHKRGIAQTEPSKLRKQAAKADNRGLVVGNSQDSTDLGSLDEETLNAAVDAVRKSGLIHEQQEHEAHAQVHQSSSSSSSVPTRRSFIKQANPTSPNNAVEHGYRADTDWEGEETHQELTFRRRFWSKVLSTLWKLTPSTLVKLAGPYGPSLIQQYTEKRFGTRMPPAFTDYIYHSLAVTGNSGELAVQYLLAPGAWAYKPLVDRVHQMQVPTVFLYGQYDWMDSQAGEEALRRLPEKLRAKSGLVITPNAGHQLFMDNPESFDRTLLDVGDLVKGKRRKWRKTETAKKSEPQPDAMTSLEADLFSG